jgi:tRNA A-37 threonylcarbamoyl transferase component Bud32
MPLPAADASSPVFGRYQLLERIGAGGMAIVYRALWNAPDGNAREVVVKRLLPELSRDRQFSAMLVAEARLSARLNHPNIVQLYELGRAGDEFFLAMELVDGVDLVRLLNRCVQAKRRLPISLGCHIVAELASALAYAHDLRDNEGRPLSIVHRDVTPSNVMVTRQGGVKLLDFGVAKAAEHVRDERTRTGTLKGKVNYLSPESADGLAVDRRTDIFALGIVLHECLTLKRLFKADGDLQTLRLIREAKVAPPSTLCPDVGPELDRVVLKMLARDPDARYADCHQLLADLLPIVRQLGGGRAGLARLVGELPPAEPQLEAPLPIDDIDAGPTPPAIEIVSLTPTPAPAPPRAKWRWPVLAGAVALPALAVALLVGRYQAPAPPVTPPAPAVTAPTPTVTAPAPAETAPVVAPATTAVAPAPAPTRPPSAAAAAPATLVVETDVQAARIVLDGRVVADGVPRARVAVARAGEHQLAVSAPRRRAFARTVTLAAGATVDVRVKLERAAAHAKPPSKPIRGENYLVNPFGH